MMRDSGKAITIHLFAAEKTKSLVNSLISDHHVFGELIEMI